MLSMLALATLAAGIAGAPAAGEVLCRKGSGAVKIREACKPKETVVDLSALQPAPTARAYACSSSGDGVSVGACFGRPSKGVLSIVVNSSYPGHTCFELDPSIDAESATAIASLNNTSAYSGGKINALIGADGYTNYQGCPANSVLVNTARHTNDGAFLGLEAVILGVNIVVP
jgi:hypothetical protein